MNGAHGSRCRGALQRQGFASGHPERRAVARKEGAGGIFGPPQAGFQQKSTGVDQALPVRRALLEPMGSVEAGP